LKAVLKNVVKEGQVKTLLKGLSMAGKQGQHKLIMLKMVVRPILCFIFVGFPADNLNILV
jgi:hypothetical protein